MKFHDFTSENFQNQGPVAKVGLICGPVGKKGILQGSRDFMTWTPLTNFTFESNLYEYSDLEAGQSSWRFYKVAPLPAKVSKIIPLGPNQRQMLIEGVGAQPGDYEGLQAIIRVSTGLIQWSPLSTNVISGGAINFTDPDANRIPHRFYRFDLVP